MRGKVVIALALITVILAASTVWSPSVSVSITSVEVANIVQFVAPREDRLLLVLGWRPALLQRQLRELIGKAKQAPTLVVLLCPDDEDILRAARIVQDNHQWSTIDIFRHPAEDRTTLLNGRYLLEAASAYLSHRASAMAIRQPAVFALADEISRVVVIDPSRAVVCGDVLAHTTTDLTVAEIPVTGKHSFQAEFEKATLFRQDSTVLALDQRPDRRRLSRAYAPQLFGGSTRIVRHFLNHTLMAMQRKSVRSGAAMEAPFTHAVISFADPKEANATTQKSGGIRLYSNVDHRRLLSRCDGHGLEGHLDVCNRVRAGQMHLVTNYLLCDPLPPAAKLQMKAETRSEVMMPQLHCRSVFTKQITVRHHPQAQNTSTTESLLLLIEPPLKPNANITDLWKSFSYTAARGKAPATTTSVVDLVVGVAMGYSSATLQKFLSSFASHHKSTTMLALVVRPEDMASLLKHVKHIGATDVLFFSSEEFVGDSPTLVKCPVVLSRMEVLSNLLRKAQAGTLRALEGKRVRRVMIVDTRDAMFQKDPFEDLSNKGTIYGTADRSDGGGDVPTLSDGPMIDTMTSVADAAPAGPPQPGTPALDGTEDFLLFPTERFPLALNEFLFFGPYSLNRFWVGGAFGMQFFNSLAHEPITGDPATSDGVTFPILCGGLYMGTINAIVDFFDVFVASAVALGGCGVNDQGLLIGLVAVGLAESRFPHPVLLSDPYTTPFTNGPRGGGEIIWDAEGRVVNCHGAPYAVVHQYDRYKAVWSAMH